MAESEKKVYREISPEELDRIIAEHKKWLETGKKDGERGFRARLVGVNLQDRMLYRTELQYAMLDGVNLQGAILHETNLQGASLNWVNLQGADLSEAILKYAELRDAKLSGANLVNADLTGAKSLLAEQLAGLDLTGTKLPPDIHNFAGPLKVVEDASKHARYIFSAMLLACIYAVLTVVTHGPFLFDLIRLPVLNIDLPAVWFYRWSPPVLLALYWYFLVYMQRLWEKVADLPAVFPDGYTLDKKVYPWLMTEIIHAHVPILRKKAKPWMFKIQMAFSILLAWCSVPATLIFIICKYWTADDVFWSIVQMGVAIIAAAIGYGSYCATVRTLSGERTDVRKDE